MYVREKRHVIGEFPLPCGVLNMEKEIEDMITGNRWKQAYEVSELPFFEEAILKLQNELLHVQSIQLILASDILSFRL